MTTIDLDVISRCIACSIEPQFCHGVSMYGMELRCSARHSSGTVLEERLPLTNYPR